MFINLWKLTQSIDHHYITECCLNYTFKFYLKFKRRKLLNYIFQLTILLNFIKPSSVINSQKKTSYVKYNRNLFSKEKHVA